MAVICRRHANLQVGTTFTAPPFASVVACRASCGACACPKGGAATCTLDFNTVSNFGTARCAPRFFPAGVQILLESIRDRADG